MKNTSIKRFVFEFEGISSILGVSSKFQPIARPERVAFFYFHGFSHVFFLRNGELHMELLNNLLTYVMESHLRFFHEDLM